MIQFPLGNSQEMPVTTTLYCFYLHTKAGHFSTKTGQGGSCVNKTTISILCFHTNVNQFKDTPYLLYNMYSTVYYVYYIHILYRMWYTVYTVYVLVLSTLCWNCFVLFFLRMWCLVQWILNLYTYCQNSVQFYSMSQNTFDQHLVHEAAEL